MNDLAQFEYINELLQIYGSLLTKAQLKIMKSYYVFNLSLSEISEELNISRSAVKDCLDKAKAKLLNYEENLKIHTKTLQITDILEKNDVDKEVKEKILEVIDNGI